MIVYLIGQISLKEPETLRWRKYVSKILGTNEKIEVYNPFDEWILKQYKDKSDDEIPNLEVIVQRTIRSVLKSDIGILNLTLYDQDRPLIGTLFEIAYYLTHPEKTLIAFCSDKETNPYVKNMFIQRAVSTWCKNENEACEIVLNYF